MGLRIKGSAVKLSDITLQIEFLIINLVVKKLKHAAAAKTGTGSNFSHHFGIGNCEVARK